MKNYTLVGSRLKSRARFSEKNFRGSAVLLGDSAATNPEYGGPIMTLALVALLTLQDPVTVDMSRYDAACGVKIEKKERALRFEWPAGGGATRAATLSLDPT